MPRLIPLCLCLCGRKIFIPWGKNTRRCPVCKAIWTKDKAGFWARNPVDVIFTPKDKFLKKKGMVRNSEDFGYPVSVDVIIDDSTKLTGSGNPETYWPRRGSFRDYAKEFEQG